MVELLHVEIYLEEASVSRADDINESLKTVVCNSSAALD